MGNDYSALFAASTDVSLLEIIRKGFLQVGCGWLPLEHVSILTLLGASLTVVGRTCR